MQSFSAASVDDLGSNHAMTPRMLEALALHSMACFDFKSVISLSMPPSLVTTMACSLLQRVMSSITVVAQL